MTITQASDRGVLEAIGKYTGFGHVILSGPAAADGSTRCSFVLPVLTDHPHTSLMPLPLCSRLPPIPCQGLIPLHALLPPLQSFASQLLLGGCSVVMPVLSGPPSHPAMTSITARLRASNLPCVGMPEEAEAGDLASDEWR